MNSSKLYKAIIWLTALVWLVNGLFCKILNLVPRHKEIVAAILGEEHSGLLTVLIGVAEILMAVWILSGIKRRESAIFQIVIISTMNLLEFFLTPELLLWKRFNLIFAIGFMVLIGYNEFVLRKNIENEIS